MAEKIRVNGKQITLYTEIVKGDNGLVYFEAVAQSENLGYWEGAYLSNTYMCAADAIAEVVNVIRDSVR